MKALKKLVQFFDKKYWKYFFQYFFLSVFVYFVGCIAPFINSSFSLIDFNEYSAELFMADLGIFIVVFLCLGILFICLFGILLFIFIGLIDILNKFISKLKS